MARFPHGLPSLVVLLGLATLGHAFYLPGVAPKDYKTGDVVALEVNSLSSLDTVLPYDFYYEQFHFCAPKTIESPSESLGSVLYGDRLHNSVFDLKMKVNESCKALCEPVTIPAKDAKFINKRIKERYQFNWVVDGLPAARPTNDTRAQQIYYSAGFELGSPKFDAKDVFIFNNHYDIFLEYSSSEPNNRVVGVLVWPQSVANPLPEKKDPSDKCLFYKKNVEHLVLSEEKDTKVQFTYNVYWVPVSTSWGTRWDKYLYGRDSRIHWFSLTNSIVIVVFLTGMVAMILLRALHKDISRYNALDEEAQEEFGWKLVHADVFRAPNHSLTLSVLIGNGAQVFFMTATTLLFALFGFLSPSARGALTTIMVLLYFLVAPVAGYVSARLYKMLGGEQWKRNAFATAFLVPGIIFGIFTLLNFFLIGAGSSAAVPAGTFFAIIGLWFGFSVPLCFVGSYFGLKAPVLEHPVRTNQIPRQIPDQPFYLSLGPSVLMGGILPFGAVFIELYFIMNSLWNHQVYYLFGFLFLVYTVLVITCSEVTVLMAYFHLCSEDYHWWWRSFLTSGASAFYVFFYSVLYFATRLRIDDFSSAVLYFGWSLVISFVFFIVTGFIGFVSTFIFVRKIYGSIKID